MKIGDLEITRLIVGSNPFTGKSHLTADVDADMRTYFSEEQAFAMLRRCEEAGINAVQSRGSMPVMGLLGRYRAAGGKMHWLAQSGKNLTTFDEELDEMMKYDPAAVCIHGDGGVLVIGLTGIDLHNTVLALIQFIPLRLGQGDALLAHGEGVGLGLGIGEVGQRAAHYGDCQHGNAQKNCKKFLFHISLLLSCRSVPRHLWQY